MDEPLNPYDEIVLNDEEDADTADDGAVINNEEDADTADDGVAPRKSTGGPSAVFLAELCLSMVAHVNPHIEPPDQAEKCPQMYLQSKHPRLICQHWVLMKEKRHPPRVA